MLLMYILIGKPKSCRGTTLKRSFSKSSSSSFGGSVFFDLLWSCEDFKTFLSNKPNIFKRLFFFGLILYCRSERIQSIGADRLLAVGPQRDLYTGTRSYELAVGRSGSQGKRHFFNKKMQK